MSSIDEEAVPQKRTYKRAREKAREAEDTDHIQTTDGERGPGKRRKVTQRQRGHNSPLERSPFSCQGDSSPPDTPPPLELEIDYQPHVEQAEQHQQHFNYCTLLPPAVEVSRPMSHHGVLFSDEARPVGHQGTLSLPAVEVVRPEGNQCHRPWSGASTSTSYHSPSFDMNYTLSPGPLPSRQGVQYRGDQALPATIGNPQPSFAELHSRAEFHAPAHESHHAYMSSRLTSPLRGSLGQSPACNSDENCQSEQSERRQHPQGSPLDFLIQIKHLNEEILTALQRVTGSVSAGIEDFDLPLQTPEQLGMFEERLDAEQDTRQALVKRLASLGGGTTGQAVRVQLRYLLADQLAAAFSFKGQKTKLSLCNLNLWTIIKEAVHSNVRTRNATEEDIRACTMVWLKNAKARKEKP